MTCNQAIDKKIFFIIIFSVKKMNKTYSGGYVRDFIIVKNVSIVTVVDCIKLAKKVCEKLDHKINIFKYFLTAIIKYNNLNYGGLFYLLKKKRKYYFYRKNII